MGLGFDDDDDMKHCFFISTVNCYCECEAARITGMELAFAYI